MSTSILSENQGFGLGESALQIVERDGIQSVSARDLHKGLGITDRFNRWFDSLLKYGFVANEDFCCVKTSTQQNQYGGVKEIDDYIISLDMAKQICMLQRSEIGRRYRNYLIRLEKAWNDPLMVVKRANQFLEQKQKELYAQCLEMQPKAVVYDELVDRSKTMNFRDMAAKLGMSQSQFMTILKSKYIYKNSIGEYRAYAEWQRYFTLRTFTRGENKTGEQLMLSMEGITYFVNKYRAGAVADSWINKELMEEAAK